MCFLAGGSKARTGRKRRPRRLEFINRRLGPEPAISWLHRNSEVLNKEASRQPLLR